MNRKVVEFVALVMLVALAAWAYVELARNGFESGQ